jgi:hypothetical protein
MMGDVYVWISDPEVAQELMARRSHLSPEGVKIEWTLFAPKFSQEYSGVSTQF